MTEGPDLSLTPAAAIRLLADVVSRAGNLLLNVGPRADGSLPAVQQDVLAGLAEWMVEGRDAIRGSRPVANHDRYRSEQPWARWTCTDDSAFAITQTDGNVAAIADVPEEVDVDRATRGAESRVELGGDGILIRAGLAHHGELPHVLRLPRR